MKNQNAENGLFIAPEESYPHLLDWVRAHSFGFGEAHPIRQVNNIYFDTMTYQAFQANLLGASIRNKVRYRWYGDATAVGSGQLEIKCKRNHLSWKKIFPIKRVPYHSGATWRVIKNILSEELPQEGRFWLHEFPQPVLINHYTRKYLISKDHAVRVTFDYGMKCYDQRYKPTPNFINRANLSNMFVLEIKCNQEDRDLCKQIASTLPIRVSRNSKYI